MCPNMHICPYKERHKKLFFLLSVKKVLLKLNVAFFRL